MRSTDMYHNVLLFDLQSLLGCRATGVAYSLVLPERVARPLRGVGERPAHKFTRRPIAVAAAQEPRQTVPNADETSYVPVDFSKAIEKTPFEEPEKPIRGPDAGTIWGLVVLSIAYLHHSTTGFALPALLPIIASDLKLEDSQGALLTAGYTILYAFALVPMGLLADRVDRPRMLSFGILGWSALTLAASNARGFGELMAARIGFAMAQATQNPICFSLIPEIFPKGRTAAMAVYNSSVYVGRAFSFAALIIAGKLGVPQGIIENLDIAYTLVPLDKVDLSLVSILYTQGDYAAVSPVYSYANEIGESVQLESAYSAWRELLGWLGPPGVLIAILCLLTVDEPRQGTKGFLGDPIKSSRFLSSTFRDEYKERKSSKQVEPAHKTPGETIPESLGKLKLLISDPAFLSLTAAATLNDVGSWALVAWQATFYQRVYEITPDTYAPLLAVVIPIGGIVGGVGAGLLGDWLNRIGARGWITAGANIAAAPFIALSILAPDYKQSFAALLVGFALSEAWRAPAAVAVREVSPSGLGSTGSAVHLSIRNVIGGFGPLAVAVIASKVDLQHAMLLVPTCYLLSGCGFLLTELAMSSKLNQK